MQPDLSKPKPAGSTHRADQDKLVLPKQEKGPTQRLQPGAKPYALRNDARKGAIHSSQAPDAVGYNPARAERGALDHQADEQEACRQAR